MVADIFSKLLNTNKVNKENDNQKTSKDPFKKNYDESHCEISNNTAKFLSALSYFTPLGWLIALLFFGHHKSDLTSFHLRQSLGIIITGALCSLIPLIGWLACLAVFFAWCYGLISAVRGETNSIPLLGDIYQGHLDFIK